jgi:hypothetical protein
MKMKVLLCIYAVVILASCRETGSDVMRDVRFNGSTLTEIYIDNIPPEVVSMNLSDIFTDFSIVPLETSENCLIGAYNKKVKITAENIFFGFFVMDQSAVLFRFDKEGNFINKIGSGGRGPGEHGGYDVQTIIADEENERVTVEWFGLLNEGPMTYTYDGAWIESIKQPMILLGGFYEWSAGEWFSRGNATGKPEFPRDSVLIIFYNKQGEITGKIPRTVYPETNSDGYTPSSSLSVHKSQGSFKIFSSESDTVYRLTRESLIASEVINRGKDAMPYNRIVDPQSILGKYDINIIAETKSNYILQKRVVTKADISEYRPGRWGGSFEADYFTLVADKKRRSVGSVKIKDDVFGIIPDKFEMNLFRYLDENRVSFPVDAIRFLKMAEDAGVDLETLAALSTNPERIKSLTAESNPVILTFTLKDYIKIE